MADAATRSGFRLAAGACILFAALTVAAMLEYPGGSVANPQSRGYSFFQNFFSDLGQTRTLSGQTNRISMGLFIFAMTLQAVGLSVFFLAFSRLFSRSPAASRLGRIAAAFGILAGICFLGVAATPWNLYLEAHNEFVLWAFRSFLAAVVFEIAAILLEGGFPLVFGWTFGAFALLLVAYVLLLALGPLPKTPDGALVQATGQKIIAYASMAMVLFQSLSASRLLGQGEPRNDRWSPAESAQPTPRH